MIDKIILFLLTFSFVFNCSTLSFHKNDNEYIKIEEQQTAIWTEQQESYINTGSEHLPVNSSSFNDKKLTGVNIINYDLNANTTTYEAFDIYSYEQKSSTDSISLAHNSEDALIDANTITLNDSESEIQYIEGYTPEIDSLKKEILDSNTLISPTSILDSDERTQISDPKILPYRKTGQIEAIYYNILNQSNGLYYTLTSSGTAFMVGANIAITAGHCVYQDVTAKGNYQDNVDNPRFPDEVHFYFGVNGTSEKTSSYQYYAIGNVINIEYSYYLSQGSAHDWSVIELNWNIGNTIGWHGLITGLNLTDMEITSHGYPADKANTTMWETSGTIINMENYTCYNNLDTYNGQSGSAYILKSDGSMTDYVCGIHTTGISLNSSYNGGTLIRPLIFYYVVSFQDSRNITKIYDYPSLSIAGKSGSTWGINIENTSSMGINLTYNSKMCFFNDAKNWTNLNDTITIYLAPYSSITVLISENVFATSIACSYIYDNYRIVSYANNLNTNGSLSCYTNLIIV